MTGSLCEDCHEPIPESRLEAMPGAKKCVKCQRASEQALKKGGSREFELPSVLASVSLPPDAYLNLR